MDGWELWIHLLTPKWTFIFMEGVFSLKHSVSIANSYFLLLRKLFLRRATRHLLSTVSRHRILVRAFSKAEGCQLPGGTASLFPSPQTPQYLPPCEEGIFQRTPGGGWSASSRFPARSLFFCLQRLGTPPPPRGGDCQEWPCFWFTVFSVPSRSLLPSPFSSPGEASIVFVFFLPIWLFIPYWFHTLTVEFWSCFFSFFFSFFLSRFIGIDLWTEL